MVVGVSYHFHGFFIGFIGEQCIVVFIGFSLVRIMHFHRVFLFHGVFIPHEALTFHGLKPPRKFLGSFIGFSLV